MEWKEVVNICLIVLCFFGCWAIVKFWWSEKRPNSVKFKGFEDYAKEVTSDYYRDKIEEQKMESK